MAMAEQTKDAIAKMLKAGFKRKDFSVQSTEWRPGYGRRYCAPRIIVYRDIDYIMEHLPDLLSVDFKVTLISFTGKFINYASIDWMHHSREPHLEIGIIHDFGAEISRKALAWDRKYGNDPRFASEARSRDLDSQRSCMYCCKPATVFVDDDRIPYCEGCFERHESPGSYDKLDRTPRGGRK